MNFRNTILAGSLAGLVGCAESSSQDGGTKQAIESQEKITQTKALKMLESESISGEAHTYPSTGDEVVFLDTNSFVGQGTYLPMEYEGDQSEYK